LDAAGGPPATGGNFFFRRHMNISSTETHPSKSVEGVNIQIRRITDFLRSQFNLKIAGERSEMSEILAKQTEMEALPTDQRDATAIQELETKWGTLLSDKMNPAYIGEFFFGCDLSVDGVQITAENLRTAAPAAFYDEVITLIRDRASLGGAQAKN
jgi:hypothetical protein